VRHTPGCRIDTKKKKMMTTPAGGPRHRRRHRLSTTSLTALAAGAAALLLGASPTPSFPRGAAAARAHGETAALDLPCLTQLNDLYATHYAPVPPSTVSPCHLLIEQALHTKVNDRCPDAAALTACFGAAPAAWSAFVHKCALFSTAPADPPAGSPVAAASVAVAEPAGAGRRLQAEGEGGEGEGEGEGEGGGGSGKGQGCFPNFKTASDFDAWLAGDFVETVDHGRVSPIAATSVAVFSVLLLSLAAV
jgi:hypothetical protein